MGFVARSEPPYGPSCSRSLVYRLTVDLWQTICESQKEDGRVVRLGGKRIPAVLQSARD